MHFRTLITLTSGLDDVFRPGYGRLEVSAGQELVGLGVKLYTINRSQCNVLTSTAVQTCVCVYCMCVPTV